jgi:hypothetical protein
MSDGDSSSPWGRAKSAPVGKFGEKSGEISRQKIFIDNNSKSLYKYKI